MNRALPSLHIDGRLKLNSYSPFESIEIRREKEETERRKKTERRKEKQKMEKEGKRRDEY